MVANTWRITVAMLGASFISVSLWLAIRGPGSLPVAAGIGILALALAAWVLVALRKANAWWATGALVTTLVALGLTFLGVLPIPLHTGAAGAVVGVLLYMVGAGPRNRRSA